MANPQFVPDEVVTAAKMNQLPKGILAYVESTTPQTGITTETDVTGMSVTVTLAAGRRIKVTGKINMRVIGDTTNRGITDMKEGSTLIQRVADLVPAANGARINSQASIVLNPSAGSHTYKMTIQRGAGTGSVENNAAAGVPNFLLVEDIGGTT